MNKQYCPKCNSRFWQIDQEGDLNCFFCGFIVYKKHILEIPEAMKKKEANVNRVTFWSA